MLGADRGVRRRRRSVAFPRGAVMDRRSFLRGAGALLAAPAIVRASSLMALSPVPLVLPAPIGGWGEPQFFTLSPEMADLLRRRMIDAQRFLAASIADNLGLTDGGSPSSLLSPL